MVERGVIHSRERKKQIVSFERLRYGNITPTDIDGFIDFKNKIFIWFELKYGNAEVPFGQRLALERLCVSAEQSDKEAIVFICTHDVSNPDDDIDASEAVVIEYFYRGTWARKEHGKSLGESIRSFLHRHGGDDILTRSSP